MSVKYGIAQEQAESKTVSQHFNPKDSGLRIGDSVPDWFWEVEFRTVNYQYGDSVVRLKDYRNQLLVIDFWATWCKPCIESVDKWEELYSEFIDDVTVLAVHAFDFEEKAKPFVDKRKWTVPVVVGSADSIVNRLFYIQNRYGQVWIKDDKLIAIPLSREVTRENVLRTIEGLPTNMRMNSNLTYFDPRLTQKNGESNENN